MTSVNASSLFSISPIKSGRILIQMLTLDGIDPVQ